MNLRLLILIPLMLIQLAVPGFMIFRQEQILQFGRVFKFKTAPVDPYDAFRGRFVSLQFALASDTGNVDYTYQNRTVWVRFGEDENGFAKISEESKIPLSGEGVLMTTRRYGRLQLPFERYYMDEHKAPNAEAAYFDNNRRNHQNVYAAVRILNGHAALEELYIDNKPILEFLRTDPKK